LAAILFSVISINLIGNRPSSASIVIKLRAGRPGLDSLQGKGFFSFPHSVQTASGFHPASYPKGTGDSFMGLKWQGYDATTHLHLTLKLMKHGTVPPLPHTSSWRGV